MTSLPDATSIRRIDERDERLLARLRLFGSVDVFQHPEDQQHLTTVVALRDDRVIGAARLYRLSIHPTRWRLAIFVESEYRRQGIGTALFNACRQDSHLHSNDEIQTSVSSSDEIDVAFLTSVGFTTLMTTYLGALTWDHIPEANVTRHSADIVTLAALPELRQQVADIHEQIYRDQHSWSPVGNLTEGFKESVFLDADELLADAQLIALRDGQVVGISSLRAPFSTQSLELGWIGVIHNLPDSIKGEVHAQLLGACFQFARQQKSSIFVEIDESDAQTLEAFQRLDIAWESQWFNLVRRV